MLNNTDSLEHSLQLLRKLAQAYAFFDADNKLLHWSPSLGNFFPNTSKQLSTNLRFDNFLKLQADSGDLTSRLAEDTEKINCSLSNGKTASIKIFRLAGGELVFACSDISYIRHSQEALLASEQKFRQFATLASNWFWELDENLCYKYHSSHCQPLAGSDPESLEGQSRILNLDGKVVDNDQLHEHNRCLLEHADVDVVLTWVGEGGKKIYSRILAKPQYSGGNFGGYLGCGRDVTAAYELREMLRYQAEHDELTGLLNRRAFAEALDETFSSTALSTAASRIQPHVLVKFNLDHFKLVNDDAGHHAGDALLKEVSAILKRETHHNSIIARLGADEFGVYMQTGLPAAQNYAERMIQRIESYRFEWHEHRFSIGASAGIAFLDENSRNSSAVLKNADAACYSAKRLGRNRALLFSAENSLQHQQNEERKKVIILQSALDNDRLKLFLQSIVPSSSNDSTIKYEVLLRVVDDNDQIISPGELIPVAEKFDLIQMIDMQVVQKSIDLLQAFLSQQINISFSVNLSGNTLSNSSCLKRIASLVRSKNLPAGSLGFEITETSAIENIKLVSKFIDQLRGMGCQFSIDDFGSGLSSYNYMNSLKVDYLKIDGSFVSTILSNQTSFAIVKSINTLSHEMGMKTVAEFVESDEVATTLRELNIDYLQGFLFGRPARAEDILNQYQDPQRKSGT